jgi:hypothetical protein
VFGWDSIPFETTRALRILKTSSPSCLLHRSSNNASHRRCPTSRAQAPLCLLEVSLYEVPLKSQPQAQSAFTRRMFLQTTATLAASSLFGCASSLVPTTSNPASVSKADLNPQPVPNGPLTQASVSISATTAGTIASAFAGLSYEKSTLYEPLFTASNSDLIGLFKRVGPSVLRIGGNSTDTTVWTPNGTGQKAGQIAPSDVASLAAFVKATGWQCLYSVNLGGAATGATTPALAAAEAAYAAEQFGSSLLGIEIGNECDAYGAAGSYFAGDWSLSQFVTLWEQFRSAILASTPNVSITGPAAAGYEIQWTVPFGQHVTKSEISLLTQHYYRGNGQLATSTATSLIAPDPTLIKDLAVLQAGAQSIGVPYRMSECNSFYNGGAVGVSDTYASSLWVVDYLFNCALGGASGVNLHGGGTGSGYTPISDSSGAVVNVRPEFYGIVLFTLAGQGTLCATQVSAASLNVTAYAVKSSSGGLNIVVVNKDLTQNLQLTLTLPQNASSATLLAMTQLSTGAASPDLLATSGVTIQGASIDLDGSFSPGSGYTLQPSGSQLTCYVPALSVALIQVS